MSPGLLVGTVLIPSNIVHLCSYMRHELQHPVVSEKQNNNEIEEVRAQILCSCIKETLRIVIHNLITKDSYLDM